MADDQFGRHNDRIFRRFGNGSGFIEPCEKQRNRLFAQTSARLTHGCKGRVVIGGEMDIIEANHGNIVRHAKPKFLGRDNDADCHAVRRAEKRRRAVFDVFEQGAGRRDTRFNRKIAAIDQGRVGFDAAA